MEGLGVLAAPPETFWPNLLASTLRVLLASFMASMMVNPDEKIESTSAEVVSITLKAVPVHSPMS